MLFYGRGSSDDHLQLKFPKVFAFLKGRLWIDEIYETYVNTIQKPFAEFLSFADEVILRGIIVRGGAGLVGILGIGFRFTSWVNSIIMFSVFVGLLLFLVIRDRFILRIFSMMYSHLLFSTIWVPFICGLVFLVLVKDVKTLGARLLGLSVQPYLLFLLGFSILIMIPIPQMVIISN